MILKLKNALNSTLNYLKKHPIKTGVFFTLLVFYYFSLPSPLFKVPYATVVESQEGRLIGAKIAKDGQWRFPENDTLPEKFKMCIVTFEDQHFYQHPGFNPVAVFNAIVQNYKAGKVVRGGSTLTQQVIRLARKGQSRTYFEKAIEFILATRLELRYSKDKILELYAAHAPFGGNVVGLEMASWRYFGLKPNQLSWSESATLAVLPNAPSLIFPGKNQQLLMAKRNKLLLKLKSNQVIDAETYNLALAEPLVGKPFPLPELAPHLVERMAKTYGGKKVQSSIDFEIQSRINDITANYYNQYKQNEVYNLAVLVLDIKTRKVVAYVGNSPTDKAHKKDVDIIQAPRSTGSILKPLLFAGMLDAGKILPNTLIADVPTQISGYTPENYSLSYDGAVAARKALSRSLNIPSVLMLQDFGVNTFYEELQKFKFTTITKSANHYGLSLILGGAESNLWDLCRTYAGLSSTLNYFNSHQGKYRKNEFAEPLFLKNKSVDFGKESFQKTIIGAGSIWLTYKAMEEVNRPEEDEAWQFYDSARKVAWKTGTSFGSRDAWAVGSDSRYVVGVWVGNATGEGRPNLTGVGSAAPIMFDVFNLFPRSNWFQPPLNDLEEVDVCQQSGSLANEGCPTMKEWIPLKGKTSALCSFHKRIQLDASEKFRVNSNCEAVENMVVKYWFVLPPVMEWYYKSKHIDYQMLPPFRQDCVGNTSGTMDFIYPKNNSKIYLTKNFSGEVQALILKVAHSQSDAILYWYVDEVFQGTTTIFHEKSILAKAGMHRITVVDGNGNEISRKIEIVR
ncbi:penicillin-binding protein 1C [Flavobacterium sp. SM2513]|uniref:penicillin-binding protein 1C n=1 Tax=Flavobacterium sp. SM2513 TaxID=3424766 RepID=UPI003D7F2FBE